MRTTVIIGGSSGIGAQLVRTLASPQHQVIATYNRHEPDSKEEFVSYHHLDVLDDVFQLEFLPDTIDGLVYCPGTINLRPFARIKPEDFLLDFRLQAVGAVKVIQACLTRLKNGTNPSILLFSSVATQVGMPFHTLVGVSKGAIEGLARSLAAELAPFIRVNCIAPSLTDTPLAGSLLNSPEKQQANAQRHPLKKIGKPGDIADMASFLLSAQAAWITGQVFHVDGGMSTLRI